MKNLENYSIRELNTREMRDTNGGIIPLLLAAYIISDIACVALTVGIYNGYQGEKQKAKIKI